MQTFPQLHNATSELLARLADIGVQLTGDSEGSSLQHVNAFWKTHADILERHRNATCNVAVLGLTKAGKSTLLNALIGARILPTSNVPETARIARLQHAPECMEPVLAGTSGGQPIIGAAAVHERLELLNKQVRQTTESAGDDEVLNVDVRMAALDSSPDRLRESVALCLLDTPGPNEAGEPALRHKVERLLDGVSAVLYVLDYTKIKTKEEATLFASMKGINPQLMKRLSQRLFFVVNKADVKHTCEGLDEAATQAYVAKLVTAQMGIAAFELRPEQVMLVSARDAYLARLVLSRQPMPPKLLGNFLEVAFGRMKTRVTEKMKLEAAQDMLAGSGMLELEQRVLHFLVSNAASIKLTASLDDMERLLNMVGNGISTETAALRKDVQDLQAEISALQGKLDATLQRFDVVQQHCLAVETEIVDEVRSRLGFLKERLTQTITVVLAANSQPPTSGRWRSVWEKARSFVARQDQEAALQQKLAELHAHIFGSLDDEAREFFAQLEVACHGRQQVLLRHLNAHLAELSAEVEDIVSQQLDIVLTPVSIKLHPPSAEDFHNTLAQLFAQVRTPSSDMHVPALYDCQTPRYKAEHVPSKLAQAVPLLSSCKPPCRDVTEEYTETIYDLDVARVRDVLVQLVSEVIDNSVRATRAFVKQYLSDTITRAQSSIASYGAQYSERMFAALTTCQQGDDVRKAALARSESHLAAVSDLLAQVAGLQAHVRDLMPADPALGHSFEDAVDVDSLLTLELDAALEGVAVGSGFFDASSLGASVASLAQTESAMGSTDAATGAHAADSDVVAAEDDGFAATDLGPVADTAAAASELQEPTASAAAEPATDADAAAALALAAVAVAASSAVPSADADPLEAAFGRVSVAHDDDDAQDEDAKELAQAINLSKGDPWAAAVSDQNPTHDAVELSAVPIVAVQHEDDDVLHGAADAPASPAPLRSSGVASPSHDDWTMVDDDLEAAVSPHAPA